MKKYLLLFLLCCLMPSIGMTESLEEIVVTASPLGKNLDELIRPVNVLTGDELEKEVASTIGETLRGQLGVNSGSFGPGVGTPVIRGLTGNRIEILQNSTSVQDVSDTSFDHAVSAEPLLAQSIEVIRGSGVMRYGDGAIGGVVNIIDNRIPRESVNETTGAIQLRFNGNNDERVAVGRVETGSGAWNFHLDGVLRESNNISIPGFADHEADDADETTDGFIENTESEATSGSFGFSYTAGDLVVGASINVLDNRYGLPPGGHGHEEEEEEHDEGEEEEEEEEQVDIDMEQTRYEFLAKRSNLTGFLDSVNFEASYTDYAHTELEIEGTEESPGTLFDVDSIDSRLEFVHQPIAGWRGALGIQYRQRDFSAVGEEAFVQPSITDNTGLYLIEERDLSFGSLEFGARISSQSIDPDIGNSIDHDSFSANAMLTVPFNEQNKVSLSLMRSERAPTAEELLSDGEHVATGTFEIGDRNLDNEAANTLELNYQFRANQLSISASLYQTLFDDYIFQRTEGTIFDEGSENCQTPMTEEEEEDGVPCFFYAQEDADFTGFEIEGKWQLNDTNAVRLWADTVRASFDSSGDVPRIPAQRIGADWDFNTGPWSFGISATITDDQDRAGANEEETEGNTRVDVSLGHRVENRHIFVYVNNAFDEDIRNATSFIRETAPEPGRAVTAGVTWHF